MSFAKTYRKRPIEIQAVQWTGDNAYGCYSWAVGPASGPVAAAVTQCFVELDSDEIYDVLPKEDVDDLREHGYTAALWVAANTDWLGIAPGSWIAKDKLGFYPIADEVFTQTYDEQVQAPDDAISIQLQVRFYGARKTVATFPLVTPDKVNPESPMALLDIGLDAALESIRTQAINEKLV